MMERAAGAVALTGAAVLLLAGCATGGSTDEPSTASGPGSYKSGSHEAEMYALGYNVITGVWLDAAPEDQKAMCDGFAIKSKAEAMRDLMPREFDTPMAEGGYNAYENWCEQ
jgi:hypothetical protein